MQEQSATAKRCMALQKHLRLIWNKLDSDSCHASSLLVQKTIARRVQDEELDMTALKNVKTSSAVFVKPMDRIAAKRQEMEWKRSS